MSVLPMSYRRRWLRRFALGLAALVLAAPAGAGAAIPDPDGSSNSATGPDALQRAVDNGLASQPESTQDGLGRPLDPELVRADPTASRPDDRPEAGGPATAPLSGQPADAEPAGFDWRDAGVGIAIGAAVVLVLAAGVLVVGRRRDSLARV